MTDDEIKKIEKRLKDIVEENEFEYFHSNNMGWYAEIRFAYMAINHQKAEIRKYKNCYEQVKWERDLFEEQCKTAKAEAIKECIEKVKAETKGIIGANFLDNLLKELVGENDG